MLKFKWLLMDKFLQIVFFGKKQATRHRKKVAKHTDEKHFWQRLSWQKIYWSLGCLTVVGVIAFGSWFFQANRFPISAVKVVGERQYVSSTTLHNVIFPHIQSGFFSVNVSNLQQQLLLLPWVKKVDVRKVWPGQLVVRISEHKPAAIWNQLFILSFAGEIISPPRKDIDMLALPKFIGPQSKQTEVWQQYLSMEAEISSLHLHILSLELAERGAWQLTLSNGIKVILGTQDISERFKRFVVAYKKEFSRNPDKISYVDLRYTSGMAVGWKSS